MADKEDRERVYAFVRQYADRTGTPPTAYQIVEELNLARDRFFELFPGGMRDVCRALGMTEPAEGFMDEGGPRARRGGLENDGGA